MKKRVKSFSFISNFKFVIKTTEQLQPKTFFLYFFSVIIGTIVPVFSIFIPTFLLYIVEKNYSPQIVVVFVLLILAISLLLALLDKVLNKESKTRISNTAKTFDLLFAKKMMSLDYELIEGPVGRTKYIKAKNALNINGVYDYVGNSLNVVIQLFGFVFSCGVISFLNPFVFLLIICAQILLLMVSYIEQIYINRGKDRRALIDRHIIEISKTAGDYVAAKDIRFFSLSKLLKKTSEYFINRKKEEYNKIYSIYFITDIASQLISVFITAGTYGFLFYILFKKGLTASEFNFYLTSILSFDIWIGKLVQSLDLLKHSHYCVSDLREFFDLETINETREYKTLEYFNKPQDIEICNLSYKYTGSDKKALSNINLTIKAGVKIAIVGLNGAGKTTLVKLLCNLYTCSCGEIKLNGININQYKKQDYYKLFSAVFQDSRFLPTSIASNISNLTFEETDCAKVNEVIDESGLSEKIKSLKNGYKTTLIKNIDESSTDLSGGEQQKLLLSRALYKNSPFLILDEPTASLDPISENELYLKYNNLAKNKTVIFITHRLSSTGFCDRIVFLDQGEIIETGTHDELIAKNGKYAQLFKLQAQYYE